MFQRILFLIDVNIEFTEVWLIIIFDVMTINYLIVIIFDCIITHNCAILIIFIAQNNVVISVFTIEVMHFPISYVLIKVSGITCLFTDEMR